jgi:hypothetical protein
MSDRFKQWAPVNARDWADGGLARSMPADPDRDDRDRYCQHPWLPTNLLLRDMRRRSASVKLAPSSRSNWTRQPPYARS